MKKCIYILILLLITVSCSIEIPESPERIVIEGWIENDEAPVVFVTSSISTTLDEMGMNDLLEHVAFNAKVTVTHNGITYPLSPTLRDEYLLKLCYTTNTLKGQVGGTYKLDVDWKGMHAEAVTSIPTPGSVDSIAIERHKTIDTLYLVKAHIVPAPDVRYYRFFGMAVNKDSTYSPSYLGTFDSNLNKDEMMAVNRGISNPIVTNEYYYSMGDSVNFKLASLESNAYEFWYKFDENNMFSHVALMPDYNNLVGNISGGLGYWFGYGIKKYQLRIEN